ncbi:hypothetical protein CRV04_02245 [Candidatus Marinarcus aquaticus]|uniref:Uncharacterized protein n=2 Tax=Candidatus Marinarcus aquaticus TaxID=2044504 RepID=A0A4Q0XVA9_9BACT|nr:hypothetical protein CRV04_02245 [Candidatus Marinarcus aquaticus]
MTFHINNMAYTINVDETLEPDIIKFLSQETHINTQELLLAYIRRTQEFYNFKKEIETISEKLPKV